MEATKVYHISDLTQYDSARNIAEALGMPYSKYDSAIPQWFSDEVFDKLGVSIWGHGIVWSYRSPDNGEPFPLTYEANLILWIFGKVTGRTFKYAVDPREM